MHPGMIGPNSEVEAERMADDYASRYKEGEVADWVPPGVRGESPWQTSGTAYVRYSCEHSKTPLRIWVRSSKKSKKHGWIYLK